MDMGYRSVGLLEETWQCARKAGAAILEVYRRPDLGAREKEDSSPITDADLASQEIIDHGLQDLTPDLPRLSEETAHADFQTRRTWRRYWLIDPLDGTREFVNRRDEFTVNIALIEDERPVLGVVYAPVLDLGFVGAVGHGSWRLDGDRQQPIRVSEEVQPTPKVLVSFSHPGKELSRYLEQLPPHELVRMGSSLKFCRLAEGLADVYPRLGPTMEWDTGAADAVLRAAGGHVIDFDGQPLRYNKEQLQNPNFVALGPSSFPWQEAWRAVNREPAEVLEA